MNIEKTDEQIGDLYMDRYYDPTDNNQSEASFTQGYQACIASIKYYEGITFEAYWNKLTDNGRLQVNRKDLHEQTWLNAWMSQRELINKQNAIIKLYEQSNDFYADPKNQIPSEYYDTGRPKADFTAPYRLDKGDLARLIKEQVGELTK